MALRTLEEAPPLIEALNLFADHYRAAMARRWCWRLGVMPRGLEEDSALISLCEQAMTEAECGPDAFFFAHRGGRGGSGALGEALADYASVADSHAYWADPAPQSLLIEEVEAIWAPIAGSDDWSLFEAKVAALRRMGEAHGTPPVPAGHT